MIIASAAALVLIGAMQAAPAASVPRWALRDDPARCVLERHSVDPLAKLSIETTPGSDTYLVAIASKEIKGTTTPTVASLSFQPSPRVIKGRASVSKLPDGMHAIWMQGVSPAVLDGLSEARTVAIAVTSDISGAVAVPAAAKAVAALRKCEADQLIEWGADAAQFAPGGKTPVALKDRDAWLSNTELMAVAKISGQSVDAVFRVAVSTSGAIDDCSLVSTNVDKAVEKAACTAVRNRRLFTPATDASGNPVRGVATFRVALLRQPG
jgi:hypothetical protein